MPVYEDNTKSIGRTPLVRINRLNAGSGCDHSGQDRGPQSGLFGEVPYRRCDGMGRRRARNVETGHVDRRGDQRQHRHCAGLRRRRTRLRLRAHHAGYHDHGATQGRGGIGSEAHIDSGRQGHEGRHGEGRGVGCLRSKDSICGSGNSTIRPIREFTRKPRGQKFGTTPRARWTSSSAVSAPAAH